MTLQFEQYWRIYADAAPSSASGHWATLQETHKDWRMWAAVALMLAAIMIYVLTLDDSLLSLVVATSLC